MPSTVASTPVGAVLLVESFGSSQIDGIDRCRFAPLPLPELLQRASTLKPGDIVVQVRASEVVWTDTVMVTGQYQHRPRLPYTPGMTYSGVVLQVTPDADGTSQVKVGDRVAIAGWDAGARSLGRYQSFGGLASYAVAPSSAVRRIPSTWSFAEASCFAYGYDTAYHCLVEVGKCKAGESILIHGATGGVGIPAVRIAKLLGLRVLVTTRDESKIDFLKSIGVDECIVLPKAAPILAAAAPGTAATLPPAAKKQRGFSVEVKRLTGGKGVDVVYDGVGGAAITVESMHALRFGGRLLIVGWASTPNVAAAGGKGGSVRPNLIPTNLIMMKSLVIMGAPAMIAAKMDPSVSTRRVKQLEQWFEQGALPPPIVAQTFPLSRAKDALRSRVASGSSVGSTVVTIDDDDVKGLLQTLPPTAARSKL